jgi:hypothetical protein
LHNADSSCNQYWDEEAGETRRGCSPEEEAISAHKKDGRCPAVRGPSGLQRLLGAWVAILFDPAPRKLFLGPKKYYLYELNMQTLPMCMYIII